MRKIWIVAMIIAAAFSVGLAACGGGSSDEGQVKAGLAREIRALKDKDWRTLYSVASPRAKEDCSYDEFLKAANSIPDFDFSKLGIRDVRVIVNGDTADVTYTTTYDGKDTDQTTSDDPDTWVKVNGHWYDDNKGESNACDLGS